MQVNLSSKPEEIYFDLKERISKQEWKVGEKIPTEIELASYFQCSRATVSKAVSRLSHEGIVERRTRAGTRVLRHVEKSRSSSLELNACAFVYASDKHEGIWRTVSGFQRAAIGARRRAIMLSTGSDFRQEAEIVGRLSEFDVKGAVLFPVIQNTQDYGYYTQMILACRFPIVLVEVNMPGLRRSAVIPDGFHAGYTMTKHLLAQGLKRIGFVANFSWAQQARDKFLGYRQAMNEAGLGEDPSLVHLDPAMTPNFSDPLEEPCRVAKEFLTRRTGLEGVVCAYDFLALAMVRTAREQGLRVPEELKVVGIDDFSISSSEEIGLTTYRIPYETIGERAWSLLDEILSGASDVGQEIQIRGHLVRRQSA